MSIPATTFTNRVLPNISETRLVCPLVDLTNNCADGFFSSLQIREVGIVFTASVVSFAVAGAQGAAIAIGACVVYKVGMYIFGVLSSSTEMIQNSGELAISPDKYSANLTHANKQFVYDRLLTAKVSDPVKFSKFTLQNPSAVQSLPLFAQQANSVKVRSGGFSYDASNSKEMHWTANFADSHLFGFCQGPLFAQDEMQVAEHLPLAHVRTALQIQGDLGTLTGNQVALLTNVKRYGAINTAKKISGGSTLYGNHFALASKNDIESCLKKFSAPTTSNIFAFAAPHIPGHLANKPYHYEHLEHLFYRSFLAFKSIKNTYGMNKKIIVHTGNWGAGAFGNDSKTVALLQLAAARLAGVDVIYYPMNAKSALAQATSLLRQIEQGHFGMNVEQFLRHLALNATKYDLCYGVSNGT